MLFLQVIIANMIKIIITAIPMFVCIFWSLTLLLALKNNNRSKNFLGINYAVASLLYFTHIVYFNQLSSLYLFWENIYIFCSIAIYPLFFIYICLITRKKSYSYKNYLILIPAILLSLFSFVLYANMSFNDRLLYTDLLFQNKTINVQNLSPILRLQIFKHKLFMVVYILQLLPIIYCSRKYIVEYNRKIKNYYSDIENKTIHLTNKWLLTFIIFSIISIVSSIIGKSLFLHSTLMLFIAVIVFSILLYMIAYLALRKNFSYEVFLDDVMKDELMLVSHAPQKENKKTIEIQKKFINDIISLLENDNIYKKHDLRISELANRLNSNRTHVSNIINDEFKTNFTDLINEYRFRYAKKVLSDPSNEHISISQVADMAGFSSDSSFYRIFKRKEGISPKDFRDIALSNR